MAKQKKIMLIQVQLGVRETFIDSDNYNYVGPTSLGSIPGGMLKWLTMKFANEQWPNLLHVHIQISYKLYTK